MEYKNTFKKYQIKRLYKIECALYKRSDHTGVGLFEVLVCRTLISYIKSGRTYVYDVSL